jgi:NAD(P)-dependent dehydrogenase (short-subunit alcohol dehydrogenase family)
VSSGGCVQKDDDNDEVDSSRISHNFYLGIEVGQQPSSSISGPFVSSHSQMTPACPYYRGFSFILLSPIAILYSVASNLYFRLVGGIPPSASCPVVLPSPAPGRVAIVTGSNTGIGFETARALAVDYGYTVVLACRSRNRAEQAARRIQQEATGARALFVHPLDLSSLQSVQDFARVLQETYGEAGIHVLVNNAGRCTNEAEATVDGMDLLFQANFVGHYALTRELLRRKLLAPNARVVNLSSVMHHFCGDSKGRLEDVGFWKKVARTGIQDSLSKRKYHLSKLAAILFSIELNRRFGDNLQAIAVNPGAVYVHS